MAYSTKSDILNQMSDVELAQLTSEEGNVVDDIVVNKAIVDADATIDSYVGKLYAVPLSTPIPARINQLSVTIAIYTLHSRRASKLGGIGEAIRTNYEDAIRFLEQAAANKVSIGVDPPPTASSGQDAVFKGNDREFTKDTLTGL